MSLELIFMGKLLGGSYITDEMRNIWSEENFIKEVLKFEAALAKAQAKIGIIPEEAAKKISELSDRGLSAEKIANVKRTARHLMVSIMYAAQEELGESGEYIHLGPTTQDVLDTSLTLMAVSATKIIIESLEDLIKTIIEKAEKYKYSVMPGRTHGQHAVPTTLGLKIALWGDEIADHIVRLREVLERMSYLKLSGAVGTMASFMHICNNDESKVYEMIQYVANELGLKASYTDLHQRIDVFAEVLNILALISSTIGRIGLEIRDLSREEVREVSEPWVPGIHGSSTMPQKRNPEPSEWLEGLAGIVRVLPLTLASVTMQHERDATRMAPEFLSLPLAFMITHAQIKQVTKIINGLQVFTDRMLKNLELSKGFMAAEPIMLELFKRTGKKVTAHKLIYNVVQKAIQNNKTFKEALLENNEVIKHLTIKDIEKLTNMEAYIGTAPYQVDVIVNKLKTIIRQVK